MWERPIVPACPPCALTHDRGWMRTSGLDPISPEQRGVESREGGERKSGFSSASPRSNAIRIAGEERDRLWQRWLAVEPQLDGYAGRRSTQTTVIALEPHDAITRP
jgi:hypothetical protein